MTYPAWHSRRPTRLPQPGCGRRVVQSVLHHDDVELLLIIALMSGSLALCGLGPVAGVAKVCKLFGGAPKLMHVAFHTFLEHMHVAVVNKDSVSTPLLN